MTMIARPTKRNKEFTGEYAKPNTTATPHSDTPASGSGDAASLTTNEAEKSVLANATFPSIAQTTRESVLFIGTQFSILYTFMYSPA